MKILKTYLTKKTRDYSFACYYSEQFNDCGSLIKMVQVVCSNGLSDKVEASPNPLHIILDS